MEVLLANEYGFCFGVERAVEMVEDALGVGAPVRTLGPLIHNTQEMQRLECEGVATVQEPAQVSKNEIAVIRAHGVTPKQYLLLLQIAGAEDGRTTVSELVDTLALTQSAVTELVQRAEQAGFVARKSGENDARVSHLSLTELGMSKLDTIHDELGPERRQFRELIERLLREN